MIQIYRHLLQRETIAGLEHQIATMKAEGVAAGAGVAGTAGISDEVCVRLCDMILV